MGQRISGDDDGDVVGDGVSDGIGGGTGDGVGGDLAPSFCLVSCETFNLAKCQARLPDHANGRQTRQAQGLLHLSALLGLHSL